MKKLVRKILDAVFPPLCHICRDRLVEGEQILCAGCLAELCVSKYMDIHDNSLAKNYWGVFPIESALTVFKFSLGNTLAEIIHHMKYFHNEELCRFMGEIMAYDARVEEMLCEADTLIPVPITAEREKHRGYNPALRICEGICRVKKMEIITDVLIRREVNNTQTAMSHHKRSKNIQGAFEMANGEKLEGKHVVLIDDIITTGATTRECLYVLRKVKGIRISVLALGSTT